MQSIYSMYRYTCSQRMGPEFLDTESPDCCGISHRLNQIFEPLQISLLNNHQNFRAVQRSYFNQIDIDSTTERLQHEHNYHWETSEHNLDLDIWKCRFIFNHHHCILKVDWYLLSFLWIKLFTLSKWLEWSKILHMYT